MDDGTQEDGKTGLKEEECFNEVATFHTQLVNVLQLKEP